MTSPIFMANLVFNKLCITGKDINPVLDFIQGDNGVIDFQKISPMPRDCQDKTAWRYRYWGTKWNAVSPSLKGNTISFDSAWSSPWKIVERLSELFKECLFTLLWDDGVQFNCGMISYKGGHERDAYIPITNQEVWDFLREHFDYSDEELRKGA